METFRTVDQQQIAHAVGKIAGDFRHEYFAARARAGEKSDELWEAVASAGFAGINLPEEHGGGAAGIAELAVVIEELAAHGCPLLMLIVSPAICGSIIFRHGTQSQRERWLPGLATGRPRMAFAVTEPDAGSNSHRISVTAKRDGDAWRLHGTTYYISGIDEADQAILFERM